MDEQRPVFPGAIQTREPVRLSTAISEWLDSVKAPDAEQEAGD